MMVKIMYAASCELKAIRRVRTWDMFSVHFLDLKAISKQRKIFGTLNGDTDNSAIAKETSQNSITVTGIQLGRRAL